MKEPRFSHCEQEIPFWCPGLVPPYQKNLGRAELEGVDLRCKKLGLTFKKFFENFPKDLLTFPAAHLLPF